MERPDLNLLVALDALLSEGSVVGAAKRLDLSPSAMSRTLARLREVTDDPLLVRGGRDMVPTPRALELRERVGPLLQEVEGLLRPAERPRLEHLQCSYTLRTGEGFVESFGPALLERVGREAPGVRLGFVQKLDKDRSPLRDGTVDLETGVVGARSGPELRAQALFRDQFVGVVRAGHPLADGAVSAAAFAAGRHIGVSHSGVERGPVERGAEAAGLQRDIAVRVDGFGKALALARASDLIAVVPDRHTRGLQEGMCRFPLPFSVPEITISLLWHPRMDGDPAHRWLRACVREVCATPGQTR
ncbi:MAG TPA: LysR family transcriptional regulator [Myxococcota bacterium]|nr:LysR family transcriptional regulator [Myxococcota bacterium]